MKCQDKFEGTYVVQFWPVKKGENSIEGLLEKGIPQMKVTF
jgi:hypothetical protein